MGDMSRSHLSLRPTSQVGQVGTFENRTSKSLGSGTVGLIVVENGGGTSRSYVSTTKFQSGDIGLFGNNPAPRCEFTPSIEYSLEMLHSKIAVLLDKDVSCSTWLTWIIIYLCANILDQIQIMMVTWLQALSHSSLSYVLQCFMSEMCQSTICSHLRSRLQSGLQPIKEARLKCESISAVSCGIK